MREPLYDLQMLWDEFTTIKQFKHLSKFCRLNSSLRIDGCGMSTSYEAGKVQGAWVMFLIAKGYNI